MADRANMPFAAYSLGMKQRLGIAAALLPNPELLILDEPTNGLDPAGIREVRSLLKELAGGGMTVFVSSHLLSEVEQICDHLVMIRNGRLLFQGHVTELLAAGGSRIVLCPEHACDTGRLVGLLRDAGFRTDVAPAAEGTQLKAHEVYEVTVHAPVESAADLNRLAALAGITLRGLRTYRPSLEETFLEATGTTDGDIDADLELNRAGGSVTDPIAPPVAGSSAAVPVTAVPDAVPAVPDAAVPAVPRSAVPGHREPDDDDVSAGATFPGSTS
jgi:ABC-2 type transport system ATP-binding protein